MSKRKNPQDKKRDSLSRDRRNSFGQNNKASRRLIPLKKALDERAHRKGARQALNVHVSVNDEDTLDLLDRKLAATTLKLLDRFEKRADEVLGEVLERRASRGLKGGSPNAKRLRRIAGLERAVEESRVQMTLLRTAIAEIKQSGREDARARQGLDELRSALAAWEKHHLARSSRLTAERHALHASSAGSPRPNDDTVQRPR